MMTRPLGTTGLHMTETGFDGGAIGGLSAAISRDADLAVQCWARKSALSLCGP